MARRRQFDNSNPVTVKVRVGPIEDRLADVFDAAGAYLTACDAIDQADNGRSSLEAICRRDAAFAELRAARYPDEHA